MRLTALSVTDYRCWRGERSFCLSGDSRPVLIGGESGCGKTALTDAVWYALAVWRSASGLHGLQKMRLSDVWQADVANKDTWSAPWAQVTAEVDIAAYGSLLLTRLQAGSENPEGVSLKDVRTASAAVNASVEAGAMRPLVLNVSEEPLGKKMSVSDNAIAEMIGAVCTKQVSASYCDPTRRSMLAGSDLREAGLVSQIALAAVRANPESKWPADVPGIVLMDNFDAGLDDAHAKSFLTRLHAVFPNIQFIASSSRRVLARLPENEVWPVSLWKGGVEKGIEPAKFWLEEGFGIEELGFPWWGSLERRRDELLQEAELTDAQRRELAEIEKQIKLINREKLKLTSPLDVAGARLTRTEALIEEIAARLNIKL